MSEERSIAKKLLDTILAASALVLLAPLLLILSLTLYVRLGSPVLFSQTRAGLNGAPFTLYKFRTMSDARDREGNLLTDKERLTPIGKFLRLSSLDELPELFNVLRGEMSMVGPRPLLMQYLPYYTPRERLRHSVRPGITGWAQVNGRNCLTWDKRLEMDAWYVENWSIWLDLRILFKTLGTVLLRDGVVVDSYEVENDLDKERQQAITFTASDYLE